MRIFGKIIYISIFILCTPIVLQRFIFNGYGYTKKFLIDIKDDYNNLFK